MRPLERQPVGTVALPFAGCVTSGKSCHRRELRLLRWENGDGDNSGCAAWRVPARPGVRHCWQQPL